MSQQLLALQAADTLADQLRHRRSHLPEQAALESANASRTAWERERSQRAERIDELERAIAATEAESSEIDRKKARLSQQLKTVIAPREAEALMHEIAILDARRSDLDDAELEALEAQSGLADEIAQLDVEGPARAAEVAAAERVVADAVAAIDAELASIAAGHDALRAVLPAVLLDRYDRLRKGQMVVVAALVGHRCEGCHLDLSATEIDEVRASARQDGMAECPHCARLLVI